MPESAEFGAALALEREGLGHHADRQRAEFLGDLGDDRGRAGAGAATHAAGDEDHVRAAQDFVQLVGAFLGSLLADFGIAARAKAARQLIANPDAGLGLGKHQGLAVGVDGDEIDAAHAFRDHAIDGIAPTATDAYYLDLGKVLTRGQIDVAHFPLLGTFVDATPPHNSRLVCG